MAYDWNLNKRKRDPKAPVKLAVALGAVYIVATLGLVVFLEVWPWLSTYAPAIFPALAVVGAINLAMIARQEIREAEVAASKAEARQRRQEKARQEEVSAGGLFGLSQVFAQPFIWMGNLWKFLWGLLFGAT